MKTIELSNLALVNGGLAEPRRPPTGSSKPGGFGDLATPREGIKGTPLGDALHQWDWLYPRSTP